MRKPRPFTEDTKRSLERLLYQTNTKADYQRVLAVWLRASMQLSASQIGTAIGMHPSSVLRIQSRYILEGPSALFEKKRGGRHRENLSVEEEKELLGPFLQQLKNAEGIDVSSVKRIYEDRLDRRVPKSTIYRILKRHGWRKDSKYHKKEKGER